MSIWRDGATKDPGFAKFKESIKRWKTANDEKDEGTKLFKEGKYEQALVHYRKAVEADENNKSFNSPVYMNIGTCLAKEGKLDKYREAIREFNKSIECNPNYAKAYMKRSDCYEKLEK